ncbi:MAG: hypothetical protein GX751_05270 [Desulfuromonadaceae bacterium]|nr:hypothetical protein [Desulfuromonadaceae bacterium]
MKTKSSGKTVASFPPQVVICTIPFFRQKPAPREHRRFLTQNSEIKRSRLFPGSPFEQVVSRIISNPFKSFRWKLPIFPSEINHHFPARELGQFFRAAFFSKKTYLDFITSLVERI